MLQMNKFKFIIVLSILLMVSCSPTETKHSDAHTAGEYSIRMIDGCEYIQVENGEKLAYNYNYTLTHKGNCKNKIHKCPCDK